MDSVVGATHRLPIPPSNFNYVTELCL
jgi:hypothetical protein